MRVAFYAPLKSPEHPVPSGDRQLARYLLQALRSRGHVVTLASRFRSFDGAGNAERQARLGTVGMRLADRLLTRYRRMPDAPQLWFTYHLHHKAPDLLGPVVSRALGIPYVVAEASVAPKQRHGRWAIGYAHALHAIRTADAVVFLNPVDIEQVTQVRAADSLAETLRPFLDVAALAGHAPTLQRAERRCRVRLITVAMMRDGAKLASYRLLATALLRVEPMQWELVVVGDGPARSRVEAAFAPFRSGQVRFAGARTGIEVAKLMHDSEVFVWPAIDEAFGMVFLEAQACGLPVVGGDGGGVAAVVAHGRSGWLAPAGSVDAFADATRSLVIDADLRARMGRDALAYVREQHDLPAAAARLDRLLMRVHAARGDGSGATPAQGSPC